jgi:hypothetical protein
MAARVGLDQTGDIRWVTSADSSVHPLELFAEGKIDAFLAIPPEPQELRARRAGHVIFSGILDRPWSQYFCNHFTMPVSSTANKGVWDRINNPQCKNKTTLQFVRSKGSESGMVHSTKSI